MDDKKLPGIAAEDIGRCAYGVFKEGPTLVGQTIGIAGDHLSGTEMAESLGRAMGQQIGFYAISATQYRSLGFPGADDLGNMFQFKRDFNDEFREPRSVERARELNPKLQSFAEWAAKHGAEIPLP